MPERQKDETKPTARPAPRPLTRVAGPIMPESQKCETKPTPVLPEASPGGSRVTTGDYDNNTGELTEIDYSDGTPHVTFAYNRLGGQATVADVLGMPQKTRASDGGMSVGRVTLLSNAARTTTPAGT